MIVGVKITVLISMLMMLSGCVGIGVLYPQDSATTDNPHVSIIRGYYSADKTPDSIDCMEVIRRWGEPSKTYRDGETSTLVYKEGLVWAGVMPIIGIPIPIAVPVGRKSTSLVCRGDDVIKAMQTETRLAAAYCGMISEKPEYGCQAENH